MLPQVAKPARYIGGEDGMKTPRHDGVRLLVDLAPQPQAMRVEEFLAALRPPLRVLRACRLHQWITTDTDQRREPLTVRELSVSAAGAAP